MKKGLISRLLNVLIVFCLSSCATVKSVPYFQNAEEYDASKGAQLYELTIKPKDLLTIFVYSGTDKEAVELFNLRDPSELDITQKEIKAYGGARMHHYLVNNEGYIDFPILGRVHVGGLTIGQVNDHIKQQGSVYLKEETYCVVNTYLENLK